MTTTIGKWLYAMELTQPPERKTKRWAICATDGEVELGQIRWFGKWRCYGYFPADETVYEKQCLRAIADFCETQTDKQRAQPIPKVKR